MATHTDQLEKLETELNVTSQKVDVLHDRTQRLLDDMHELKSAVRNLYEILEAQSKEE